MHVCEYCGQPHEHVSLEGMCAACWDAINLEQFRVAESLPPLAPKIETQLPTLTDIAGLDGLAITAVLKRVTDDED